MTQDDVKSTSRFVDTGFSFSYKTLTEMMQDLLSMINLFLRLLKVQAFSSMRRDA